MGLHDQNIHNGKKLWPFENSRQKCLKCFQMFVNVLHNLEGQIMVQHWRNIFKGYKLMMFHV
jgi:hypothetical protein